METEDQFSYIASLFGDKARAMMLFNLLDGRAYTATELAICAEISRQSASNHLVKLMEADLLIVEKQGRYRYFRFAKPEVAYAIEAMGCLMPSDKKMRPKSDLEPSGIVYSRICYDHLAGKAGVMVTDAFIHYKFIEPVGKNYAITTLGIDWFESIGIDVKALKSQKRSFAHQCLDWNERRHHLAGALGASFLQKMMDKGWIRKKQNSGEVVITGLGSKELYSRLNISL